MKGLLKLNAPGTRAGVAEVVVWESEVRRQWEHTEKN